MADVSSYLPNQGHVAVRAKEVGDHYIRRPAWALRGAVRTYPGSGEAPADWWGVYLRIRAAGEGEELTITYPPIEFEQAVGLGMADRPDDYAESA